MHTRLRAKHPISEATEEIQTPSRPQMRGRVNTRITGRIMLLTREMMAEISPLLRAVNRAEAMILSPANRYMGL